VDENNAKLVKILVSLHDYALIDVVMAQLNGK
jgi:hypothetical protein